MSGASKGGRAGGSGPDKPTLPVAPPAGQDKTHVDFSTDVGLAHTIASTGTASGSTGEIMMSAQLPSQDSMVGGRASSVPPVGPSIPPLSTPQPSGALALQMLPGSSSDLAPGTMVGEYRIEGKLGEGGMGTVFAAIHPVIGKRAAIKVIKLELCANAEAVERFVQEARAVNQIGHTNIVDVFAFGTLPDGRRYLVMEWLKGESLAARLKRDKLSVEEVCDVLDPICRALEGAHEKRIIHRDLKPDNVFLVAVRGERPIVKLLDFGIAKLVGTEDTRLERTRTGSMLGTPAYISPEQARGRGVDERTDIYALGAMAFEMFTGRQPFPADNAMDMISSHLHDAPPAPCTVSPGLPAALDTLLLGMLEKEAGMRPSLARVRETLAEVKKAPMSTRATVRAEPPLVDRHAKPGSAAARTAPGASVTMTDPQGTAVAATTTANIVRRAGKSKWLFLGVVTGVAAVATIALTQRGGGGGAPARPAAGVVSEPTKSVEPPPAQPPPVVAPPPAVEVAAVRPGKLAVIVNVPDATIEIGGQSVKATGGRASVSLPPGDYELVVSAPGRKPFSKKLTLDAGATVDEKVRLDRGKGGVAGKPPVTGGKPPAGKPAGPKEPGSKDPATKDPGKKPPGDDDTIW